jgi:hypothetical protein
MNSKDATEIMRKWLAGQVGTSRKGGRQVRRIIVEFFRWIWYGGEWVDAVADSGFQFSG